MTQQFLFPEELETTTHSVLGDFYGSQITGDMGEIEFDRFCTQNNISSYSARSAAAPIDRIIVTKTGKTVKVHVKASIRVKNVHGSDRYIFTTNKSLVLADYYFCVGIDKTNYSSDFILWIPFEIGKNRRLEIRASCLDKYSEYLKPPANIMDAANILQFPCP
jgi:hypothetical protein